MVEGVVWVFRIVCSLFTFGMFLGMCSVWWRRLKSLYLGKAMEINENEFGV